MPDVLCIFANNLTIKLETATVHVYTIHVHLTVQGMLASLAPSCYNKCINDSFGTVSSLHLLFTHFPSHKHGLQSRTTVSGWEKKGFCLYCDLDMSASSLHRESASPPRPFIIILLCGV